MSKIAFGGFGLLRRKDWENNFPHITPLFDVIRRTLYGVMSLL